MKHLYTQFALPTDPDLDGFLSGVDEVDHYFRSRAWFDSKKEIASPPTYQFRTEEDGYVVGYASVGFRNLPHPSDEAAERARYLVIYVVGVHLRFRGVRNPSRPSDTYAASIFDELEELARQRSDCVGLSLWVRTDNLRAIAFYRKLGFAADPAGPVHRDGGSPHLTMRKVW
ncbi:MAG: GNAT family N-acetyltransferase [Polyangiaceae bacterium]